MYIENKEANNSSSTVTLTKVLKVSDLQFKEEYRNMVYSLGSAEYESLKHSISKEGVLIPVEINDKNEILDGNHRAQIAIELGLECIPVIVRNFDTELQEKIFVVECNLERRQLNDFQKGELYHKLYQLDEEQEAKNRKLAMLKNVGNNNTIGPSSVSRDTN
jgi:ParB-like chromosome segregation protein Spo0J